MVKHICDRCGKEGVEFKPDGSSSFPEGLREVCADCNDWLTEALQGIHEKVRAYEDKLLTELKEAPSGKRTQA